MPSNMEIRSDNEDMYALEIGLWVIRECYEPRIAKEHIVRTYRRRSSSFLITHSVPDLLHCVHSLSPLGTTQRILRSRQEAQATEARWRT